jgi:hypothetical protein
MKKVLSVFMLITILNVNLFAQDYTWSKSSSNGFEYQFVKNDPMKSRFYILKNGLTVILSENKETPRLQTIILKLAAKPIQVTIQVWRIIWSICFLKEQINMVR